MFHHFANKQQFCIHPVKNMAGEGGRHLKTKLGSEPSQLMYLLNYQYISSTHCIEISQWFAPNDALLSNHTDRDREWEVHDFYHNFFALADIKTEMEIQDFFCWSGKEQKEIEMSVLNVIIMDSNLLLIASIIFQLIRREIAICRLVTYHTGYASYPDN